MAGNYLPRKEPRRALAFVLSLALLVSSLGFFGMTTEPVYAEEPEEVADPIEVIFSFVYEDTFEVVPQKLTVKAGMAYDYGIGDAPTVYPTVLDAVVAAHEVKYGSNFTPESAGNYLDENLLFAFQKTAYFGHAINRTYNGEAAKEARLYDGDLIEIFCYLDESFYDYYTIFSSDSNLVEAGSDILLTLKGFCYGWDGYLNPTPSPVAEAAVSIIDMKTGEIIVMDGKTTDSEGQVVLNFDTVGKYYISATGTIEIALTDAPIIPAWYQITVIDPTEPHVTVRIEGNGYGTDGINDNIKEVIQSTVVNLSELGPAPTALDAVNYALQSNNIYEEVSPGWLETVGGVSAMDDSGASWMFMYNDEHSSTTLNQTNISNGDNIVLCLAVYDLTTDTYTTDYQYFKVIGYSSDVNGGSAYGEVTLALYNKKNIGRDSDYNIMWDITPVGNATIYVNKNQAYTPDGDWAVTDSMSGLATITLRGGTSAGIYNFDIGSMVEGSTNAYCRVTMIYDGSNAPVLLFSQPSAADTSLATVDLSLNEEEPIDALPYINKDGLIVNYAVDTARVSATPKDSNASIEAMFKGAGDADFSAYDLEEGESVSLAVGKNIFRFIVTNNEHEQDYTLVITRKDSNVGDISEDVNAVINGVKSVRVGDHLTDWILAMNTAGFTVPEADKMDYLAPALFHINSFADSGTGNVGPIAKTAIALTALGIDVRQIPDPDGGDAPINLINLIAGYEDSVDKYSAPYILSLYDLERTSGEKVYPLPADLVLTREKLIDVILDAQEGTGLFGSIDVTGMVFSALAPYYLAEEGAEVNGVNSEMMNEIKNAVDDAVTLLSEKQIIDGGFGDPNSNTTSTVIIGLAALNINPHSDDRFIKHGSTLITNLLSFRTTDNKLGYRSNATANDYACVQGFQALAAYKNLISQKNSNIYHFPAEVSVFTNWPEAKLLTGISVTKLPGKTTYNLNEGGGSATTVDTDGMEVTAYYNGELSNSKVIEEGYTVSTIDTTTPGTKVVIVTYQGHTTIFNVTVLDSSGSVPREETVKITIKSSGKGTIASDRAYVIESGKTTVMDVLKAVLSKAGVLYRVTYGNEMVSLPPNSEMFFLPLVTFILYTGLSPAASRCFTLKSLFEACSKVE
jgi:hypothetical protein